MYLHLVSSKAALRKKISDLRIRKKNNGKYFFYKFAEDVSIRLKPPLDT